MCPGSSLSRTPADFAAGHIWAPVIIVVFFFFVVELNWLFVSHIICIVGVFYYRQIFFLSPLELTISLHF
jgi:hypothetical protein